MLNGTFLRPAAKGLFPATAASPRRVQRISRIPGAFADSLAALTRHIEHLIDEPRQPPARVSSAVAVPRRNQAPDPAVVRYSLKVGLCVVAGFIVGITTQRGDLSTIMITVLITALPTYGAALNKMILRIVGATISKC
jgi:uncharacterized membrane protein YccC